MIGDVIRQLCVLSVFCGAALCLAPEGGVKRIMGILCSVLTILTILKPVADFDYQSYAFELAKYRMYEDEFARLNQDSNERLNRLVIQSSCEAYILDKAAEQGLDPKSVNVEARWSMDGFWVPDSVSISCNCDGEKMQLMQGIIEAELGIPAERQYWDSNG